MRLTFERLDTRTSRALVAPLLLGLAAAPSRAVPPPPLDVRVNTYTTGNQTAGFGGAVSSDGAGRFVVVWSTSSRGVLGQRFGGSSRPLGDEFQVRSSGSTPAVAAVPDGSFVVAWYDSNGVHAQRYDGSGVPVGPPFRVSTYAGGSFISVRIAAEPGGRFALVWRCDGQDGSSGGIFGRRLDTGGQPAGDEFRVSTTTTDYQGRPSVAFGPGGQFLVAWHSRTSARTDVLAQRFAQTGAPLGAEFRVNADTTFSHDDPAVAGKPDGFVVVWEAYPSQAILARFYTAAGTPVAPPFRLDGTDGSSKAFTAVTTESSGAFVAAWTASSPDGQQGGIFAARFGASGYPIGVPFRVNTITTGDQTSPSVRSISNDNFVVVWNSAGQDGDGTGIFARQLCRHGDADGNGVLNVSDVLFLINNLFAGGPSSVGCADADGNGVLNVSDVLYLINHLFAGGPAPL